MGIKSFLGLGSEQEPLSDNKSIVDGEGSEVLFESPEIKSASLGGSGYDSLLNFMTNNGHHDLSAHMAFSLYKQTAPLFTAVKKITNELSSIRPVLYDPNTKEYISEHPMLDLINQPNAVVRSRREFVRDLATNYILSGNAYIWATGPGNRPPLELFVAGSNTVTIQTSQIDGYPASMKVNATGGRITFKREDEGRIFRYFWTKDGEAAGELYQIRDFNSCSSNNQKSFGLSPLTPIHAEIEQYNLSSLHNRGLLKRGATIGGMMTTTGAPLDQDREDRLKAEIDKFYSGAANSGRVMVASGNMKFENMMQSNKDMDFDNLKKSVTTSIYNALDIPLPLINPDHMTLSNYDSARLAFYEEAVLPLFELVMGEIYTMIHVRYDDLRNKEMILTYNPRDIEALELKHMNKLKGESELGILSINEQRRETGREDVEGGDEIFVKKGGTPLGKEQERHDAEVEERRLRRAEIGRRTINRDEDLDEEEAEAEKMAEIYRESFRAEVDAEGKCMWDDDQIEELVKKWLK